jgi:hypothetical protein
MCSASRWRGYDAFAIFAAAIRIDVATFFPSFGRTLTFTRSPSFNEPPRTRVAAVHVIGISLPFASFNEKVFDFASTADTVPDIVIACAPFAIATEETHSAAANTIKRTRALFFMGPLFLSTVSLGRAR